MVFYLRDQFQKAYRGMRMQESKFAMMIQVHKIWLEKMDRQAAKLEPT
jgi:hypothetical protein